MTSLIPPFVRSYRALLLWAGLFCTVVAGSTVQGAVAGAIVIYPQNSSLEIGGPLSCTAYVPISPNTVTWQVNGVVGGNATIGTISATGVYQPPVAIPTPNTVTISAQSTANPSSIGSTSLTLTRKVPNVWSVNPTKIAAGTYAVTFNGSNFAADTIATANGVDLATTYISPTSLMANGTAAVGTIKFAARQPDRAAWSSTTVNATVVASTVTLAVTPASASVGLGVTQAFSAKVTGSTNTSVTWNVNGTAGGNSTVGTISGAGVYTAPSVMPSPATVTVQAVSVASPSVTGQATVL